MWLRYDGPESERDPTTRIILSDGTRLPLGRPVEVDQEAADEAHALSGHAFSDVDGPADRLRKEPESVPESVEDAPEQSVEADQE